LRHSVTYKRINRKSVNLFSGAERTTPLSDSHLLGYEIGIPEPNHATFIQ
jgi:hypothetical protein